MGGRANPFRSALFLLRPFHFVTQGRLLSKTISFNEGVEHQQSPASHLSEQVTG